MSPVKSRLEEKGAEILNGGKSRCGGSQKEKKPLKNATHPGGTHHHPVSFPPGFGQAAHADSCCIPPAPLPLILGLDGEAETFPLLG